MAGGLASGKTPVIMRCCARGSPPALRSARRTLPTLTRLEVTPGYRVLRDPKSSVQMSVIAVYSDGSREDVTGMAVYSSNDDAVLKPNIRGLVTPQGGTGDAAIMVRYAGAFASAVYGATTLPVPAKFPAAPENVVDREVYAKLRDLHIVPSARASDEEFVRRIYLHLNGTLPSAADVRQFVASSAPDKRRTLIDQLLERPEWADLQTLIWADRLRSDVRFHRTGGVRSYYRWMREEFAANRPLDKFARELLTARGTNYSLGPPNYWGNYDKISTPVEVAIQTGQVFLGVRIGCAQCHNHPFEKWTQNDFLFAGGGVLTGGGVPDQEQPGVRPADRAGAGADPARYQAGGGPSGFGWRGTGCGAGGGPAPGIRDLVDFERESFLCSSHGEPDLARADGTGPGGSGR